MSENVAVASRLKSIGIASVVLLVVAGSVVLGVCGSGRCATSSGASNTDREAITSSSSSIAADGKNEHAFSM